MPSQPPLPATLSRYLRPGPPGSLSLVTSVLDATGNWLFLRLLYAVLTAKLDDAEGDNTCCVVFVDFLQCFDFWRGEAKRAVVSRIDQFKARVFHDFIGQILGI